jgi:hypothetical protein
MTMEIDGCGGGGAVVELEPVGWLPAPPQLARNRQITRHPRVEMIVHRESCGTKGLPRTPSSATLSCDMKSPPENGRDGAQIRGRTDFPQWTGPSFALNKIFPANLLNRIP